MKTLLVLSCIVAVSLAQRPDDGTTRNCFSTPEEFEAVANCDCVVRLNDVTDCPECPSDCSSRCPERARCDLVCPDGFEEDDNDCPLCMCRERDDDSDDERFTIEEIIERLRCHPDCIEIREERFRCDMDCNSTTVDREDECSDTRPCEDGERCILTGLGLTRECFEFPDMGEECATYDPIDDGTREEDDDDDDDDYRMERFDDEEFNDGADDRFFAGFLMEDINECRTGLSCDSDTRTCGMIEGPCMDAVTAGDVSIDRCDEDGNFDVRRCDERLGSPPTRYTCSCARPDNGMRVFGTERGVDDPREFDRRDCVRRIFRNCSVPRGQGRSSQVYHGDDYVMDTDTGCRACRCDNGTGVRCRDVDSDRCPRSNQGRDCTRRNGDTVEDGDRLMIGDCNLCRCVDGDLQCTRDRNCGGEEEEEDEQETMCRACSSMPRDVVCGPDGRTFPSMCTAMRCGGFSSDQDRNVPGPCANSPVCSIVPCRAGYVCARTAGAACTGRCEPNELRECVNRTRLRCDANTTAEGTQAVCGSDGRSYRSFCHMIKLGPVDVRVAHRGRCDSTDCTGGMVCGTDGVTYNSRCEIRTLTANARIDHMGECEKDDDRAMTDDQLCQMTRDSERCSSTSCSMMVMPRQGCCPVCGGITTVALDRDRMEETKQASGERFDIDDIMDRIQEYNLIPEEDFKMCDVKATLPTTTTKTNMEIAFEATGDARESKAAYCKMASERLAETLNSEATSVPDIATFASAAVSAPLIIDDSGAPALSGSLLAVMMAAVFAVASLLF